MGLLDQLLTTSYYSVGNVGLINLINATNDYVNGKKDDISIISAYSFEEEKINTSLPIRRFKYKVRCMSYDSVVTYLQNGWPVLIPGYKQWFYIQNLKKEPISEYVLGIIDYTFLIEVPLNIKISCLNLIPLNQFDKNIENEEIYKYARKLKLC